MPRRERGRPSPDTQRATSLLVGGLVGGHGAAALCIVGFAVFSDVWAAVSAALAAAVVLGFYTIALGVQVAVSDASPKTVLVAWLASYVGRVTILGLVLAAVLSQAERWSWLDPVAVVVTTIAVVIGWLATELHAYSRLRIPVYDEPIPPRGGSM